MLFWGLHLLIVASVCTTEGGCAGDNDSAYWHSPVFTLAGTVRYGSVLDLRRDFYMFCGPEYVAHARLLFVFGCVCLNA